MIKCTILKISVAPTSGKTWLKVMIGGEFPHQMIVQSSKAATDYVIDQEISVPLGALRPIGTAPAAPAVPA